VPPGDDTTHGGDDASGDDTTHVWVCHPVMTLPMVVMMPPGDDTTHGRLWPPNEYQNVTTAQIQ